jgi:pyruvate/2-oxoglutarate dehydrogenase complex dihydrolipoamide acyltransferase (E2) component
MPTKINLPKSGMGIAEGTIAKWHKSVGEQVTEGEVLVDVETEKAVQEVLAPASGRLIEILTPEGTVAPVNSTLGFIQE